MPFARIERIQTTLSASSKVLKSSPLPWPKGREDKDVSRPGDFMDFEDSGDHDPFPLPSVFRDVTIFDVLMDFVRPIQERCVYLPVRDPMTLFEHVRIVDEDRSSFDQAHDFLSQFAQVLEANADPTTIPYMFRIIYVYLRYPVRILAHASF